MAVPTYDQFIEPLLQFLAKQSAPVAAKDAHEAVASALGLTVEQRAETVSSGQLVYKNRAGWGHDRLKRSGYSSSPKRGYWQLTPAGFEYFKSAIFPLPPEEVRRLAADAVDVRLRPTLVDDVAPVSAPLQVPISLIQSPDDRLDAAIAEIRTSVAADVLVWDTGRTDQHFSAWEARVMAVLTESSRSTSWGWKRCTCRPNVGKA